MLKFNKFDVYVKSTKLLLVTGEPSV